MEFSDYDSTDSGKPAARHGFLTIVLLLVIAFLVFAIVSGTVWAFTSGHARHGAKVSGNPSVAGRLLFAGGTRNPAREEVLASDPAGKTAIFGDIGMLRARTADNGPVTVVISPFIPYSADDIAFQEELVSKTRSIRTCILGWFASKKIKEIDGFGEVRVKAELVRSINSLLVLGKIDKIYFDEYMVLE